MTPDLSVKIGSLQLKNPVMVASGTFGYAEEFADFVDLKALGAVVTKTITVNPRQGNPPPRTCETPSGMLNSIGLENPGVKYFISEKLPFLHALKVPVIVSIASEHDTQEFIALIEALDAQECVAGYELNISCPNVHNQGKLIAQDASATREVVRSVRAHTKKILITKLSPNVTDIVEIAQAACEGGSDALALINTLTGMSIDAGSRTPKIAKVVGGLSGPAVRPVAVRMVWEVAQKISVPIIGMGGIIDTASAVEFFLAGATAVSVGTANFINPGVTKEIIEGLRGYLRTHALASITELRGAIIRE